MYKILPWGGGGSICSSRSSTSVLKAQLPLTHNNVFQYIHLPVWKWPVRVYWVRGFSQKIKINCLKLCLKRLSNCMIEPAIQWFQITHIITFATIQNSAVYLSGARVSTFPTLVPRLEWVYWGGGGEGYTYFVPRNECWRQLKKPILPLYVAIWGQRI